MILSSVGNIFRYTGDGKEVCPSLCKHLQGRVGKDSLPQMHQNTFPVLGYLDNIFGIWPYSEEEFFEFYNILNNHHPAISLKAKIHKEKIHFLDTQVYVSRGSDGKLMLGTGVYFKNTNTRVIT